VTSPTVSVVMAAYEGAALIGATIDTLLAQTFGDWELVVVDDCSPDDTREVIRGYDDPRIRLIAAEANVGPVRTRNRAFAQARGRYIAGLDQDDLCHPERFAAQVAYLDAHPDVALVGTAATELRDGKVIASQLPPTTSPALVEWLLHLQNPLVWSSVMFRADAARRWPEMTRPELLYAEDFDLYHRLARHGRIARLDRELLTYRSHAGGASQQFTERMEQSAAAVLAECYAPVFGDDSAARAALVVRHVMGRRTVPDGDTLRQLGEIITALQAHHFARVQPDRESRWQIRWETARLWARIGRAALRSGSVDIADRLAARPDHLGLGHAGPHEMIANGIIGAVRRARR
jgi:hypothetical protein